MRKKILIFGEYYIPAKNYGGPLTSIKNIVNTCSDDFEFYIVSYNHDFNDQKPFYGIKDGWNNVDKAKVLYCNDKSLRFNKHKLIEIVNMENFDLVWLTGIFRPEKKWIVIWYCNKYKIPVLISPRGEVSPGAIKLKKTKKVVYSLLVRMVSLFKHSYFHITHNDELVGLQKYFNIDNNRIFFAPNIASEVDFRDDKNKEVGKIDFIFISRIHKKKNLKFAIEAVSKLEGSINFDIYGPIEDEVYWNEMKKLISMAPKNISIKYKGIVEPDNVKDIFNNYHFLLFPTFSENYGHVIAESMNNSCPVIISKNTTPWDDLNDYTGLVISLTDVDFFTNKLQELVNIDNKQYQEFLQLNYQYITKKMSENDAVQKHKNMINEILESKI